MNLMTPARLARRPIAARHQGVPRLRSNEYRREIRKVSAKVNALGYSNIVAYMARMIRVSRRRK